MASNYRMTTTKIMIIEFKMKFKGVGGDAGQDIGEERGEDSGGS